ATDDARALKAYVAARAADGFGTPDDAAKRYAALLAAAPADSSLAARTYSQALIAGEFGLALTAAKALERSGALKPDARILLLADAVRTEEWKRATLQIAEIEKDETLGFMAPIVRAWIALGSKRGDPLTVLAAGDANPITLSYAKEHRPLLLLASGRTEQGAKELAAVADADDIRGQRLRIAGAAALIKKRERAAALGLLAGDARALAVARATIEQRRPLSGQITTPAAGLAELLVRIGIDLHRQQASELGVSFAQMAVMLAPGNSEARLVASEILKTLDHPDLALAVLKSAEKNDPFSSAFAEARIGLLGASGDSAAALAEAEAAVRAAGAGVDDWTRLGTLQGELGRNAAAVTAHGRALTLGKAGDSDQPLWVLHLLYGGSLEEAGQWSAAKAELEAAYALAPKQAIVLNYLGYAQLERRENIAAAMTLVAEASRLEPDSPEITDSLGWAHFLQGDVAKATTLLERAVAGAPADPEINEHLGDAYYSAGRRYEARHAWKAALIFAEGPDATRISAKIDAGLTPELASP
ncbi:MAG: hypothetical protein M3Q15_06665, partial [Pseudomonadota bacterium]|nr:hypothetical protein [Pseudomonadota bacterium]